MSRKEYMEQLSYLLQGIPENEKEEALAYYEDYFVEAGEGNAAQVIETLGSPEKVAAIIKDGLIEGSDQTIEYTETGYQDDKFSEFRDVPKPQMNFDSEQEQAKDTQGHLPKSNRNRRLLLIIAALIFVPLVGEMVGGLLEIVIGIAAGLVGTLAGGVGFIGTGIAQMFTAPSNGLLLMGGGMISVAIGLLLLLVCIKIFGGIIRWIIKTGAEIAVKRSNRGGSQI